MINLFIYFYLIKAKFAFFLVMEILNKVNLVNFFLKNFLVYKVKGFGEVEKYRKDTKVTVFSLTSIFNNLKYGIYGVPT